MKKLGPLLRSVDARAVKPEPKLTDPLYLSPEYRAWREQVIARAGRRCQNLEEATGLRCTKAEPRHRMFADHIIEVKDGGARFDPRNGMCLCGRHHTLKTMRVRAERLGR